MNGTNAFIDQQHGYLYKGSRRFGMSVYKEKVSLQKLGVHTDALLWASSNCLGQLESISNTPPCTKLRLVFVVFLA